MRTRTTGNEGQVRRYWRTEYLEGVDFLTASIRRAPTHCHLHHGFTISAVESGTLPLAYRDVTLPLQPGDIVISGPDVPQSYAALNGLCKYRTLIVGERAIPASLAGTLAGENASVARISDRAAWSCFIEGTGSVENGSKSDSDFVETVSLRLLGKVAENVAYRFRIESPEIRTAKSYIEAHYDRSPKIEELAAVVHLSPFYLMRRFKAEVGISTHAFLNQFRIKKAREWIGQRKSLADITYDLGFVDQSHFYRTFSKVVGISAANYISGLH